MRFRTWVSAVVLLAVIFGPLGFHGVGHQLSNSWHAGHSSHGAQGTTNCTACSLTKTAALTAPGTVHLAPLQTISNESICLADLWVGAARANGDLQRAPPALT